MNNKRLMIAWTFFIIWMILIFYMSHQPGDVSSEQSKLVISIFEIIGINLSDKLGDLATVIVRKGAHFTEYFILYFLAVNVLKNYYKTSKAMCYAFGVVFFYACSDEIHQYFIPGREMAAKDIMIDSIGGATAYLVNKIYLIKIQRNYDK